MHRGGLSGAVSVRVADVADAALSQRYGMLGTMSELGALDYPYWSRRSLPMRIRQKA
jgi:hypothetical protein